MIEQGETIERYPQDVPYPSRLLPGPCRWLCLACRGADNEAGGEVIVVTAYEPDHGLWQPGFRRRRE